MSIPSEIVIKLELINIEKNYFNIIFKNHN